jgi:hypothetical protein
LDERRWEKVTGFRSNSTGPSVKRLSGQGERDRAGAAQKCPSFIQ